MSMMSPDVVCLNFFLSQCFSQGSSQGATTTLHIIGVLKEILPYLPGQVCVTCTWSDSLRRRANARNVSFRISLRWLIYIVNSVDKTKLSCNTPTDAAPQFLQKLTPFTCTCIVTCTCMCMHVHVCLYLTNFLLKWEKVTPKSLLCCLHV